MSDELHDRLQAYCRRAFPDRPGARVCDVTCITAGWESDMYAFDLEYDADGTRRREGLVLRIYPGDDAYDKSGREFEALRRLQRAGYPVPDVLCLEREDPSFGKPFLIMERIQGQELGQVIAAAPQQKQQELLTLFCTLFTRLHALDWRPFVDDPARYEAGGPYQFIDEWLAAARAALGSGASPGLAALVDWVEERRARVPCPRPAVVHWDFHPSNILLRDDGSPVVIDWTGLHVTDPRFDLAWTLILVYSYAGALPRAYILGEYERLIGAKVEEIEFFEVCACCRRLNDVGVSLSQGAEKQGMRPEAVAMMKEQRGAIANVYELLRARTGLRVPEIEGLLTSLG